MRSGWNTHTFDAIMQFVLLSFSDIIVGKLLPSNHPKLLETDVQIWSVLSIWCKMLYQYCNKENQVYTQDMFYV